MPQVGILFEINHAESLPGETVRVVGNRPELGAWDPSSAASSGAQEDTLQLRTGAVRYPRWSTVTPTWMDFDEEELLDQMELEVEFEDIIPDGWMGGRKHSMGSSTDSSTATPPSHASSSALCFPVMEVEYKYVKDSRQLSTVGSPFSWEQGANRRVAVPMEPGSMWLVSDAHWSTDQPPTISRIVQAELLARCMELDPDHITKTKSMKCSLKYAQSAGPNDLLELAGNCFSIASPVHMESQELEDFAIDTEFDILKPANLPILLEKCEAEHAASQLIDEVLSLQKENAKVKAEKANSAEEAKNLLTEVLYLKETILNLTEGAAEQSRREERLCQESEELRGENRDLREELNSLRSQNENLLGEATSLRQSVQDERNRAKQLEDEVDELRSRNEQLNGETSSLQKKVSVMQTERQKQDRKIEGLQAKVLELEKKQAAGGSLQGVLQKRVITLEKQNDELHRVYAEMKEKLEALTAQNAQLQAQLAAVQEQKEDLETKVAGLETKSDELQEEVADLLEKNESIFAELVQVAAPSLQGSDGTLRRQRSNSLICHGDEQADLQIQLQQIRSSLSRPAGKQQQPTDNEVETELMKVLRRRRERTECHC